MRWTRLSAIVGIYQEEEKFSLLEQGTKLMECLKKFPANDTQIWNEKNVFLGCHNQWITPESIGETLPFYDSERRMAITSDAIIDNRMELFEELQIAKPFRNHMTDSQLILLAYLKWGEDSPKHLIGDFAYMIWDYDNQKLFGARDFSGSRTLYYYKDQLRFAFSTTIEPLFSLPNIKKDLNDEWLAEFIAIPTIVESVNVFSTVYKNINQVPPSHSISVVEGRVKLTKYMNVAPDIQLKFNSDEDYEEAFRDVFERAVTERIRTFGEVGSHLSGGLDSGTVVSFASKALGKNKKQLYTYSYVPEDDFVDWTPYYYTPDESPFIKETVNHVGNITDHYLDFKGKSPLAEVNEFLNIMEMPYKFFENTFWLKGIYEEAQERNIKIMLNGARGNHSISWGSWNLTMNYYSNLLKKLRWVRLYRELGEYCKNYKTGKSVMAPIVVKKTFSNLFSSTNKPTYEFPSIINPSFAQKTRVYERLIEFGMDITGGNIATNRLDTYRRLHYEQPYYWNKNGTATTKLSLRYGLWDRDPTNDLRVIQFCLAIPEEQYVKGGIERAFIRRATRGLLPDKVRMNHRTRGIQGADVVHRMKGNWQMFIRELENLIADPVMNDVLNIEVLKNAISKIKGEPRPEFVTSNEFKILTRSLILNRFVNERG